MLSSMTWALVGEEQTGRMLELSTCWAIAKAWSAATIAEMYTVAILYCSVHDDVDSLSMRITRTTIYNYFFEL